MNQPLIPWAPCLPTRWRAARGDVLTQRVKRSPREEDGVVTAFRDGQVTLRTNRRVDGFTEALQEIGYQGIRSGDLVIHGMDAFSGAIGVSDSDGKASPVVHAYTMRDADARFVAHSLRVAARLGYVQSLAKGIRERSTAFDAKTFKTLRLPAPPLTEQRAIADYIDRETAKIDTLIEKQTTMIERLRERQDAVVRRTLLKGLRQTEAWRAAPFGEDAIPAHWRIMPASYICTITTGTFDSKDAAPEGAYPFYVRGRKILRLDAYDFNGEAVLTPGDGQGGTGKVFHYASGKFAAHQRVYVFHRFRSMEARYFYRWLSTFLRPVALAGSYTVAMESLRRPLLASFRVAVPPLDEQREIADYLDRETEKIDTVIRKVERHIELAKERRAALITAAVTGHIDVTTTSKSGDAA